jgi:uncharacterized protein (TIGR02246 family)
MNNNDAAALAALFTEDAVFVTDSGPVHGRQAIEKQYAEWFKGANASDHIGKRDPNSVRIIGPADNIAIACGEWSSHLASSGREACPTEGLLVSG